MLELRKLNGKTRVLRYSMRAADASRCSAVLQPLVLVQGRYVADAAKSPVLLAPAVSLGSRVVASGGVGANAGTFTFSQDPMTAGCEHIIPIQCTCI